MNYKIVDNGNSMYGIVETKTNRRIVDNLPSRDKAKTVLRHFNMGGGFDGYSPDFLFERIKITGV